MPRSLLAGYMRDVVLTGTGRSLRGNPWRIAGKTGTAELSGKPSHSWFVGFAPFGPATRRIAFAVVIENAGYGGGQRRAGRRRDRRRGGARRAREDELTMDILGKARRLESTIAARLDRAAKEFVGLAGAREPLEIVHAILDIVEHEIQPGSRGTRVFPFNRIEIAVLAPSREARGRLEAVFAGDPPLPARIVRTAAVRRLSDSRSRRRRSTTSREARRTGETREFDVAFAQGRRTDRRTASGRVDTGSHRADASLAALPSGAATRSWPTGSTWGDARR